ncbi:MAG: universal stress protein [Bdellovibrionales bacterium]|nr:universal stress protein [Bdellovibrionales bacterium]
MGANISYKLKNSLQGALAGGGDPATSPLYVFGPFLSLVVGAGVADVTFGTSIWMAVVTVFCVSALYRYVMKWVTDGSGGSGLNEEEFGGGAVKVNAAITVIEYTLTFLVSIAALVTFIADRIPSLKTTLGFFDMRVFVAIGVSLFVVWVVNRGPRLASRFFGPATAAVLLFLWLMIFSVIWQLGFNLPDFNFSAFDGDHIHFTLGGFARILALMTGIEIFANLVAAYEGTNEQKSRRAFGSLVIVMGTTVTTMIIVGPAIFSLADPLTVGEKSVFTQTMDKLLPAPISYLGSLIGIAVLLSAAAASAQGIQNLALGLRGRHYIPARWGQRNKFDVPHIPAWIQGWIVVFCFLLFGTHEETYLALYAAGVFILLSMTGWASFKRFLRKMREGLSFSSLGGGLVALLSAICSSVATIIIFEERFFEGASSYFLLVPGLYFGFSFFRRRLGPPPEDIEHRLAAILNSGPIGLTSGGQSREEQSLLKIEKILVPLDGDTVSETAYYMAVRMAQQFNSQVHLLHVQDKTSEKKEIQTGKYFQILREVGGLDPSSVAENYVRGEPKLEIAQHSRSGAFDLICMASVGRSGSERLIKESTSYGVIFENTPPILLLRPSRHWQSRFCSFGHILVALDGSDLAEKSLPYVRAYAAHFSSKVTLASIPEEQGNEELAEKMRAYLEKIAVPLRGLNLDVDVFVGGSGPARTLIQLCDELKVDLIAMASHGRGGLERQKVVKLGSVVDTIITETHCPILFISAQSEMTHN